MEFFVNAIRKLVDRRRGRQRRRENGVMCPCMDMPRNFDVHVVDLNLSFS